jgi:hypothetical protein
MSSYPKAQTDHISRLNNFSRQKIRLSTISITLFNANDQIVLELPLGLVDLSTFTLQGRLSTANGVVDTGIYAPFIEGCIDSNMIEVGGVMIQSGFTNYNDLFNIFRQYTLADRYSFRQVLQNELEQPPGGPLAIYECQSKPFAIYSWLGFLGSVKVLDTTILPPVKIYFRLAPNSILTSAGVGGAAVVYRFEEVRATVDILSVDDGVYITDEIIYNMVLPELKICLLHGRCWLLCQPPQPQHKGRNGLYECFGRLQPAYRLLQKSVGMTQQLGAQQPQRMFLCNQLCCKP